MQIPKQNVVNHPITKIMEKPDILFCIGKIQNIADGTKTEADHSLLHCRIFKNFFQNIEYSPASAVS